jgi:hypothetical protein
VSGYAFHPEAFADLADHWDYVADHSIDAADRMLEEVFNA